MHLFTLSYRNSHAKASAGSLIQLSLAGWTAMNEWMSEQNDLSFTVLVTSPKWTSLQLLRPFLFFLVKGVYLAQCPYTLRTEEEIIFWMESCPQGGCYLWLVKQEQRKMSVFRQQWVSSFPLFIWWWLIISWVNLDIHPRNIFLGTMMASITSEV